jgi:hypothetical protein
MKRATYATVVHHIIRPVGEEICVASSWQHANSPLGVVWEGEVDEQSWDQRLHMAYERWRIVAHGLMRKSEDLIDRHKVGAALILAILELRPLKFVSFPSGFEEMAAPENSAVRVPRLALYANEILALEVGMKVVSRVLRTNARLSGDIALANICDAEVEYPQTNCEKGYLWQTHIVLHRISRALSSTLPDSE